MIVSQQPHTHIHSEIPACTSTFEEKTLRLNFCCGLAVDCWFVIVIVIVVVVVVGGGGGGGDGSGGGGCSCGDGGGVCVPY